MLGLLVLEANYGKNIFIESYNGKKGLAETLGVNLIQS